MKAFVERNKVPVAERKDDEKDDFKLYEIDRQIRLRMSLPFVGGSPIP